MRLLVYLEKDSLVQPIFDAMDVFSKLHTLKARNLVFSTLVLNVRKISEFYFQDRTALTGR